jgi:hypothetical protein
MIDSGPVGRVGETRALPDLRLEALFRVLHRIDAAHTIESARHRTGIVEVAFENPNSGFLQRFYLRLLGISSKGPHGKAESLQVM